MHRLNYPCSQADFSLKNGTEKNTTQRLIGEKSGLGLRLRLNQTVPKSNHFQMNA